MQGQIQPVRLGGRFQYHLLLQSHCGFTTVKEINHILEHYFDKTMDVKMVLYRECWYPNFTNHRE